MTIQKDPHLVKFVGISKISIKYVNHYLPTYYLKRGHTMSKINLFSIVKVVYRQMGNFLAVSWREHNTFR